MKFKKYRKFIYILTVFVLISILLCNTFISFAADYNYSLAVNKPNTSATEGYIEYIMLQNSSGIIFPCVTFWNLTGAFSSDNSSTVFPEVSVMVTSSGINLNPFFYTAGAQNDVDIININCGSVQGYGWCGYWSSTSDTDVYVGEPGEYTILAYKVYGNASVNSNSMAPNSDFAWTFMYQEDSRLYEAMLTLAATLTNNNQVISDSAENIQKNADKNTDEIKENQDKNTDKITNGWEQDDDFDKSASDNYSAKEKELLESSKESRENTLNFLRQGLDTVPIYGRCLVCATFIFNELSNIPFLQHLLRFSLTIGSFAFVFSIATMVFRSLPSFDKSNSKFYVTNKYYNTSRNRRG